MEDKCASGDGYSPTVAGGHHPIDLDVVTDLDGQHHGEPAGAQPRLRLRPGDKPSFDLHI